MSTPWTPPFLVKLGLDANADAREVRRAYAQRLKQIDQAADPDGFQALRTAYESALTWLARRVSTEVAPQAPEQHGELEGAPARPAESRPATTQQSTAVPDADVDPRNLGDLVFEELSTMGFEGSAGELRQRLDNALADARLINIEARTWFEWRVASLLLDGWQAGHEVLFVCACQSFNWEKDQRRLTLFGRTGAVLDAAIREKLTFHSQSGTKSELQRQLVRELRTGPMPSAKKLVHVLPSLQDLMQRYPHWLRIIAPHGRYLEWNAAYEALVPRSAEFGMPSESSSVQTSKGTYRGPGTLLFVMIILIVVAMAIGAMQKESERASRNTLSQSQRSASGPLPLAPFGTGTGAWTERRSGISSRSQEFNGLEPRVLDSAQTIDFDMAKIVSKRGSQGPQAQPAPASPPSPQLAIGATRDPFDTGPQVVHSESLPEPVAKPVEAVRDTPPGQPTRSHDWRESLTTKPRTTPPTGDWRDNLTPPPAPMKGEWKAPSPWLTSGQQGASAPDHKP